MRGRGCMGAVYRVEDTKAREEIDLTPSHRSSF